MARFEKLHCKLCQLKGNCFPSERNDFMRLAFRVNVSDEIRDLFVGLRNANTGQITGFFFFFLQLLRGNDFPHPVPLFESRLVGDRNSEVRLAGLPSLLLKPNLAFYI